jgi:hypothetical protein
MVVVFFLRTSFTLLSAGDFFEALSAPPAVAVGVVGSCDDLTNIFRRVTLAVVLLLPFNLGDVFGEVFDGGGAMMDGISCSLAARAAPHTGQLSL